MHEIQNELVYVFFAGFNCHGLAAIHPDPGVKHLEASRTIAIYYGKGGSKIWTSSDWGHTFDRIASAYRRYLKNGKVDRFEEFSIRPTDIEEFSRHLGEFLGEFPAYHHLVNPKCVICKKPTTGAKVCSRACRQKLYRIQKKQNEKIQMG